MEENYAQDSIIELYFKEKGIKPKNCQVTFNESGLMGYSLKMIYTTNENSEPQKEILTQRDRENLLARELLRLRKDVFI
jgi:hypothetical protein